MNSVLLSLLALLFSVSGPVMKWNAEIWHSPLAAASVSAAWNEFEAATRGQFATPAQAGTGASLKPAAVNRPEPCVEAIGSGRQYGVSWFDKQIADAILAKPRLGRPNEPHFFMPLEDSAIVRNAFDANRYSGRSPGTDRALISGQPVYGLVFPTEGLALRVPTAADAHGWEHFLEGGKTAVRTSTDATGGYLLNPTRELVTRGGGQMPVGSVLFELGANGEWIPIKKW